MTTQPEQILENNLLSQLQKMAYKSDVIKDETQTNYFSVAGKSRSPRGTNRS